MSIVPKIVKQIFVEAVENIDPSDWPVFVTGACSGNAELQQQVEELLKAHQQEDSLFDIPPTVAQRISEPLGKCIGKYKLLQKIGEGGFGVVYMAEQTRPVRRNVALKIIRPGMDSKEVIARFEAERQALAMMDHPNIAKVLDGGETESGHPYFVMELVKGIQLTKFCDENKLDTRSRLSLFKDVCNAIQHAHQKGVIHRDIKPSNVMVTLHDGEPVPKVIDFGVSKAISQQLTAKTLFTQYGQMIGTPQYMSPEQAEMSGLDIDTRSDIYSLGVLLYELLTGTTPLDPKRLRQTAYAELQRMIREDEPPRPSRRLSTLGEQTAKIASNRSASLKALCSVLQGELDWIAMKALDKDRNRRYETAKGLANDVQRYLNNEVVFARPPSSWYLLSKFVQRHQGPVVAGSAIVACLLVAIVLVSLIGLQLRNALRNEELARADAESHKRLASTDRDNALHANAELRESNYAFSIEAAFKAMEIGSLDRLAELFDDESPKLDLDGKDLRGFEWRLLKQFYDENFPQNTHYLPEDPVDLEFSPSGRYIVAALKSGKISVIDLIDRSVQNFDLGLHEVSEITGADLVLFENEDTVLLGGGIQDPSADFRGRILTLKVSPERNVSIIGTISVPQPVHSIALDLQGRILFSVRTANKTCRIDHDGVIDPNFSLSGVDPVLFGNKLATRSIGDVIPNRGIWFYDSETGNLLQGFETGSQPQAVTFSQSNLTMFASDSSGIWRHEIREDSTVDRRRLTWRRAMDTVLLNETLLAAAGADDNAIRLIDCETGDTVRRLLHNARIVRLAFSSDGRSLASAASDKTVRIWSLPDSSKYFGRGPALWWAPFAVAGDANLVGYLAAANRVQVRHIGGGILSEVDIPDENGQHALGSSISLTADGRLLAVGTRRGRSYIVDLQTNARTELEIGGSSVKLAPDGGAIVVDASECLYLPLENGQPTGQQLSLGENGEFVVFSDDAAIVAVGSRSSDSVRVWHSKEDSLTTLPSEGLQSLSISPNNRHIALASVSDEVKVYDVITGELVHTLTGNGYWLTCAKFSPDGLTLAAASPIGEIRFWRMPSGMPAGGMTMEKGLRKIEFTTDGERLVWASMDGDVGFLQAAPETALSASPD